MSKQFELNVKIKQTTVPLVVCVIILLLSFTKVFVRSDNFLYDTFLRLTTAHSSKEISPKILSVDISDNTEFLISDELDSRQAFFDVFEVLSQLEATSSFDFTFDSNKNVQIDEKIANIIPNLSKTVFAITPLTKDETFYSGVSLSDNELEVLKKHIWYPQIIGKKTNQPERFILPYKKFFEKSPSLASIGARSDFDGVYRKINLFCFWQDGIIPSYSLATVVKFYEINPADITITLGKTVQLPLKNGKKISIPIDKNGATYIPYAGKWEKTGRHIPFEKIVQANYDEDTFWELYDLADGNILLFSDLSTAKKDFGISPLENVYPLAGIHQSVVNAVLSNSFFYEYSVGGKIFLSIAVFVMVLLASGCKSNKRCYLVYLFVFVCIFADFFAMWCFASYVPSCTNLLTAILFSFLASFILREFSSYKERILMQNALSRYFPKALAERVLKEGKTELPPSKKELTMLFSDIAGFTHWSSTKSPESVHAFLSDYLSSMAEIIFENGGTVDKFIGDGILAFFGDPVDQPDNAERAVRTGIQMQKKIRELAEKWRPIVDIDLHVRIGINSGEVIVGNLGTKVRIDYTVIGAAVNLASRMESNAPKDGILIAPNAYEKVKDKFEFTEKVEVAAKGYDVPVKAHVVKIN